MTPAPELPLLGPTLAVVAHPDDESFGLGGLLGRLADAGVPTGVLCLTRGERSTLGGGDTAGLGDDLATVRADEMAAAAKVLGIGGVELRDHPDGGLAGLPLEVLADEVRRVLERDRPSLLLVFDEGGVTGHPDHERATEAALAASGSLPVLAWVVPDDVAATLNAELGTAFAGRDRDRTDYAVTVDRARQLEAIACHRSQSSDNPVLWRRLDLQGDREACRWLRAPAHWPRTRPVSPPPGPGAPAHGPSGAPVSRTGLPRGPAGAVTGLRPPATRGRR